MFDLGESRWADLDADLAKYEDKLPYVDWLATREESAVCLGGVKGEEWLDVDVARLVVRVTGDGVSGMRPPAVFDENRP